MHPYATDSSERKQVPLILAGFAIAAAWGLTRLLMVLDFQIAWWIDAPSTMLFYGIFYTLFDKVHSIVECGKCHNIVESGI